jgi:MYXO-CTERM domain-containing protein
MKQISTVRAAAAAAVLALSSASSLATVISASVNVVDLLTPSSFNFSFSRPLEPTAGPVTLKLTLSGSCTDSDNNGCSATPNGASGFFANGYLDSTLLISGGSAFSGPAGGSGSFASTLFTVDLPAGPYSGMLLDLRFLGSGGGDALAFSVSLELTPTIRDPNAIPEPGSWALAALALGAAGAASRRRKA